MLGMPTSLSASPFVCGMPPTHLSVLLLLCCPPSHCALLCVRAPTQMASWLLVVIWVWRSPQRRSSWHKR